MLTAAAVAAAVLGLLSVQRYRDFQEARFDLGNMVQVVFNTAHGHVLEASDPSGQEVSRLASHVDPVLAVFAVPWLVWPNPAMLLVAQAIIVALAAWPAYRLGLRMLGDPRAAMCCAFALLLYPPLQYAVLDDFHAVTLAIPLLLWGFLFLEEDHRWRAVALLALAALCKEEVPLVIAFMGGYFALRKRALWPLAITAGALAYFAFAVFVVIPHFNQRQSPFIGRYAQYGDSCGGHGAARAPAPRLGDHRLLRATERHLPGQAPGAVCVYVAPEPPDRPDRAARARPERLVGQGRPAQHRVPLRGRRGPCAVRRRRSRGWRGSADTSRGVAGDARLSRAATTALGGGRSVSPSWSLRPA